jgi:predicted secreted protein
MSMALAAGPLRAQQALRLDPSTFARPPALDAAIDQWPKAAFESPTVDAALGALGITNPQPGAAVLLDAPDIALDAQPIRIAVETSRPKVDRVVLLADRLPRPLLALLVPVAASPTRVGISVFLPRTTRVRAYVRSDATWYMVQREVKLALERV